MFAIRLGCALLLAGSVLAQECVLKANTAGPLRLGMTMRQARAAMPGARFAASKDADHQPILVVTRDGKPLVDIYGDEAGVKDTSRIEDFRVYDPACATADGVHPGMLVKDVEQKWGPVTRLLITDVENLEQAEFQKQPSWIEVAVGHGEAGVYPKGKRCTKQYKPDAKVASLWVTHPGVPRLPNDENTCNVPAGKR